MDCHTANHCLPPPVVDTKLQIWIFVFKFRFQKLSKLISRLRKKRPATAGLYRQSSQNTPISGVSSRVFANFSS